MKARSIRFALGLAVALLFTHQQSYAGFTLFQSQPNSVFINTPTQVKFVADIDPNPNLIKQSVNLLRQTPSGWKVVGTLRDDGLLGDALANDNKYTLQTNLNETNLTQLSFQVSAAYRGAVQRDQSAPISIDVVAGNSLQISAGQSEIVIAQGQSASMAFSLEIFNQGGSQANLTALEAINPPSGLGLVSDYPGGWSTNATNKTFLVQNTFTGNNIGDYEVTLIGMLNLSGGIQQTAKVLVRVIDSSGIGQLSLTTGESGLQTGSSSKPVRFSATYSLGEKIPAAVTLNEVDAQGNLLTTLGSMRDDGVDPDFSAQDLVYSAISTLTPGSQPTTRYFRATANFGGGTLIQSAIVKLQVVPYSIGFISFGENHIVQDQTTGSRFYCNQVMVTFKENVQPVEIQTAVNSINGMIIGVEPKIRGYQIEIPCNGTTGVFSAINILQQNPAVESASANSLTFTTAVTPDDTKYVQQWAPNKVRADEAWVVSRGGAVIAILDSGVDYNHEDLSGKVIKGKDYWNNDNDPMDDNGHGTHLAGIAAANGNNTKGIAGISWNSKILAIKTQAADGAGSTGTMASGIRYAADNGARVINLSISAGTINNAQVANAVAYAVSLGKLVISSADNNGNSTPHYPCAYANVLCVGATTTTDGRKSDSNFGSHVDIAAPGDNILSTYPTSIVASGYHSLGGTSQAAPLVAGVAALVWKRYPTWTAGQVSDRLIKTGAPLTGLQMGTRVDAFEAAFNGSFEHDLSGWKSIGTTSALSNLGPISPTAGKKMGMASTGPDGTVSQSELYQEFTVQAGVTSLPIQFNYAMITEEYPEWVGTSYNDDITIELVTPDGTKQLAIETVNGSSFSPITGIDFPGGDDTVGWTGWKPINITVPVPPGGATFKLRVRDRGDGIYDTNAIIDNIRFK